MSPTRTVQRSQMVFDFAKAELAPMPAFPHGFWLVPWSRTLIDPHADVLHRSFRNDSDGAVFPTFREYHNCRNLIEMLADSPMFLPAATLLIAHGEPNGMFEFVANIQGMQLSDSVGAIQNVAVLPEFRRRGLGQALVLAALQGFQSAGVRRVTLEATTDNAAAVNLYGRIGFTTFRVYLREVFGNKQ